MQSTPFIAAGGKCVGVVSTHFANVHTPTEIEMETLQQYGFVAADFIISKTQDPMGRWIATGTLAE